MKKRDFFLFVSALVLSTLISCTEDEEAEWRDANIAFMKEVSRMEGIHTIGDTLNGYTGIYYQILESGDTTTASPIIGNDVYVNYAGWLYNDTTAFDSDEDYLVTVGSSVIEGWSLALEQMHVGDTWKIYIPYYLGYGTSDYDDIPAYSALIFNIHLEEIVSTD